MAGRHGETPHPPLPERDKTTSLYPSIHPAPRLSPGIAFCKSPPSCKANGASRQEHCKEAGFAAWRWLALHLRLVPVSQPLFKRVSASPRTRRHFYSVGLLGVRPGIFDQDQSRLVRTGNTTMTDNNGEESSSCLVALLVTPRVKQPSSFIFIRDVAVQLKKKNGRFFLCFVVIFLSYIKSLSWSRTPNLDTLCS